MPSAIIRKLRSRFRRRTDADFDTEIATHVALLADHYARQGMPPEEAARTARLQFGNSTLLKEERRAMQTFPALEQLWRDLRYAARVLKKSPSFTAGVVATLALSIGANAAIFGVVSGVLLHPLPYREPNRVMMLEDRWLPRFPSFETTPQEFRAWQDQSHAFEQLAAFAPMGFTLTGAGLPERIPGARISANLASLLGVNPVIGRAFHEEDDHEGSDRVVLIGYGLWQRRFAADRQVVGRVLTLNNIGFTVIGVMPPDFRFPQVAEIWKPMGFTAEDLNKGHFIRAVGRLKAGVTPKQAQAEMDLIMPRVSPVWRGSVTPLLEYYVGDLRTTLFVLLGAAGFVLLIACVNVANLQLARGSARQQEISLRISLGASRGRVLRQLLVESFLLAAIGGGLGAAVGGMGIAALKALVPSGIPRLDQVTMDIRTLLYATGLSAIAAIAFGILPAFRLANSGLQSSLSIGGRIPGTRAHRQSRQAFMVAEIALALVLLAGAGLLVKSFDRLLQVRTGFQPEGLLAARIDLPPAKYREPRAQTEFMNRLLEKLGGLPDVRQAAISAGLPFHDAMDVGISFDQPPDAAVAGTTANYYGVSASYFKTMGIPLIRGRFFTERDYAMSPPVVVINETMAATFFANDNPIGKRLDISGPTYMREIVGVVGDVKQSGLKGRVAPQVYEPLVQKPSLHLYVVVGALGDPARLADVLRNQVTAIDKDQPITQVRTIQQSVAASTTQDRLSVVVLALFAGLAIVLAATGIYGVFAYSFSQRTREIGIRMALGARRAELLKLALGECLRLALVAIAIGLAASAMLTRFIARLLYEVKPTDPIVLAAVSAILAGVALTAAFGPAWRASRVDPVIALKHE
jgi:putative ABC transport system permease protein